MAKEFIIGRTAESPIQIPEQCDRVALRHARILIDDNGQWIIEGLHDQVPTFARDDNGQFCRVFRKVIDENTVIRLGDEGYNSFTFMAHRVIEPDPKSYSYEFNRLRKELQNQLELESRLEDKRSHNMFLVRMSSVVACVLSFMVQYCVPGMKDHPEANINITRGLMTAMPIMAGLYFKVDRRAMNTLKYRRQEVLKCPKCRRLLSEFDVKNMACPHCKAM